MLKAVDILVGVAVVMMVFSAMVTIITQSVINWRNMKGKHLLVGLADLLEQLSPGMNRLCAEHIAETILRHPLIREGEQKLGSLVQRDELTTLLLDFAHGNGTVKIDEASRKMLESALVANGIQKPGEVLERVRSVALQIELANPELSNSVRHNLALLREANSAFLAKLNGWFDQTMDRVTDRFTLSTRYVTFIAAFALAFVLQLDTLLLVNHLAKDPGLREALVEVAKNSTQSNTEAAQAAASARADAMKQLQQFDLVQLPSSVQGWLDYWSPANFVLQIFGILLSSILLSLGAPFWYKMLTSLLRLRGVLAPKEEKERGERQTTQTETAAATAGGLGNLG